MEDMLKTALGKILRPVQNILTQLLGDKSELWQEIFSLMSRMRPETILSALRGYPLPIWKRLNVGGVDKSYFLPHACNTIFAPSKTGGAEIRISNNGEDFLNRAGFPSDVEKGVEFILVPHSHFVAELESRRSDTTLIPPQSVERDVKSMLKDDFLADFGFEMCKQSDAAYLRLAFLEQAVLPADADGHDLISGSIVVGASPLNMGGTEFFAVMDATETCNLVRCSPDVCDSAQAFQQEGYVVGLQEEEIASKVKARYIIKPSSPVAFARGFCFHVVY